MKIGIVGQGYVGTAIKVGFEPHYTVETYDKYDGFILLTLWCFAPFPFNRM